MIALSGKTASGKNSIRDELEKLGYSSIITYTTRPMRNEEVQDLTYHFITEEEFLKKKEDGFFAETTSYNVATGETWHYGTSIESLNDKNGVLIVNPDGLRELRKYKGLNIVGFYIIADEDTIWNRLRMRGDSAEESRRRINADEEDFKDITNHIDYAVSNTNKTPCCTAGIVKYLYDLELLQRNEI